MYRTPKEIRSAWGDCRRCGLRAGAKNMVFGEGNSNADIMIIGEAPGEWEDSTEVPFIGESGDVLTLFLHNTKLLREAFTDRELDALQAGTLQGVTIREKRNNIYMTNLVQCRPPDNRNPSDIEVKACWPRLAAQIYSVDPMLIIALGGVAARFLMDRDVTITTERGSVLDITFPGLTGNYQIPVMLCLHPAYLMRNADRRPGGIWEKMHNDLEMAKTIVETAKAAYRGDNVH